jgi:hypothetical protein
MGAEVVALVGDHRPSRLDGQGGELTLRRLHLGRRERPVERLTRHAGLRASDTQQEDEQRSTLTRILLKVTRATARN